MGMFYGTGRTNNEAEMFAARDALHVLYKLQLERPDLRLPARMFGDSQLITRFLTRVYKVPTR